MSSCPLPDKREPVREAGAAGVCSGVEEIVAAAAALAASSSRPSRRRRQKRIRLSSPSDVDLSSPGTDLSPDEDPAASKFVTSFNEVWHEQVTLGSSALCGMVVC